MKVRLSLLIVLCNFFTSFSQSCCDGKCACGDTDPTTTTLFLASTDSIINITDTSATITGSVRFPDCCYYKGQLKFIAMAAWDTTCSTICTYWAQYPNINPNSYPHSINISYVVYDSTKRSDRQGQYTLKISHLKQNTSYYTRFYICFSLYESFSIGGMWVNPGQNVFENGKIVEFKTKPGRPGNNYIKSENLTICESNNSYPSVIKLRGSLPNKGNGKYSYLWQEFVGNGWYPAIDINNDSVNTRNLTIQSGFFDYSVQHRYRRIVTSGSYSDTSQVLTVSILAPGSLNNVSLEVVQLPGLSKEIILATTLNNYSGIYGVQWQDSIAGKSGFETVKSEINGSLVLPVTTDTSNNYRAVVTIGPGCPNYNGPVIGISPQDGSGNIYPVILIGTQYWLMSNLRTEKLIDGTAISLVNDNKSWAGATGSAFCWHNSDSTDAVPFGALYNGYVLYNHSDKMCPVGWHVPNWRQWQGLATYVGGANGFSAGMNLKTTSIWVQPNMAFNSFNFDAVPAGKRNSDGRFSDKFNSAYWGFFNSTGKWGYVQLINSSPLLFDNASIGGNINPQLLNQGYSIRCVK